MKKNWIDFKALRGQLDFEAVLRHYKIEVKRKGHQHHGYCPLPNHNGKRNSPSFSANLEKGIFQCFGCGAKGNVLDFATLMEGFDPKDGAQLRRVASELQAKFCPELSEATAEKDEPLPEPKKPATNALVVVNEPLNFELKGLNPNHPYLLDRGFTPETIERFGLGFCSRGSLKDRIAVPLFDHEARLIGYAGRVVNDSAITEDNPRYKLPGEREREGKLHEFRKTLFLYNGHRIGGPVDDLVVVEGFPGVWWLDQHGIINVVATMGADCSERQAELIVSLVKPAGTVWILSDGDKAGDRHAHAVLALVSPYRLIRWLKLSDGKQPTDLSGEDLKMRFIE